MTYFYSGECVYGVYITEQISPDKSQPVLMATLCFLIYGFYKYIITSHSVGLIVRLKINPKKQIFNVYTLKCVQILFYLKGWLQVKFWEWFYSSVTLICPLLQKKISYPESS